MPSVIKIVGIAFFLCLVGGVAFIALTDVTVEQERITQPIPLENAL